jgi:hypothetical protein
MKIAARLMMIAVGLANFSALVLPAQSHSIGLAGGSLPLKFSSHHVAYTGRLGGLSGSQSNYVQSLKYTIFSSYRAGQANSGGGIITSGMLNGTGYYNEAVGGSNTFISAGFNQYAVGSSPANTGPGAIFPSSSVNFINFQVNQKAVPILVTSLNGQHISGAKSAILSQYATAADAGYVHGLAGGKLASGALFGTIFSNNNVPPTSYFGQANYALTFGRAALNTGTTGSIVTVSGQNGYIIYADGVRSRVTSGLLVGTFNGPNMIPFTGPSFPQYGLFAIGSSPFNVHAPSTFNFGSVPLSMLLLHKHR